MKHGCFGLTSYKDAEQDSPKVHNQHEINDLVKDLNRSASYECDRPYWAQMLGGRPVFACFYAVKQRYSEIRFRGTIADY